MRNIRGVIPHISLAFTLCSQTTTAQQILQIELDELKKNQKPNPYFKSRRPAKMADAAVHQFERRK